MAWDVLYPPGMNNTNRIKALFVPLFDMSGTATDAFASLGLTSEEWRHARRNAVAVCWCERCKGGLAEFCPDMR